MDSSAHPNTSEKIDFNFHHPRPLLIVISGFSGVGKDTVLQELKRRNLPFHFVVTTTSRPRREGEQEGVDYFFVSREKFEEMIGAGELIEYAIVYDDYKGVPRAQVDQALASGKDVIMRLDVQGAETFRKLYPEAVLIFLTPGSYDEWVQQLRSRGTESVEALRKRILKAQEEREKLPIFDYIVTNAYGKLDEAVEEVICIIKAEHRRQYHRKLQE